jgi:folate-binding protein YgfZ
MTSPTDDWAAAREGAIVLVLPDLAWIAIDGADAPAFLQGQLSNDVDALAPGQVQRTTYNSPKGRMLASGLLWRSGEAPPWRLGVDAGIAEAIRKRLAMFVLRSKVTLSVEADIVSIGVGGPRARAAVVSALGVEPRAFVALAVPGSAAQVIGWPDGRVVVVATATEADALVARLANHAERARPAAWRWLGIRAGVPVVSGATQDRHVAQTANFDALGGLSFTKGCYPGQEIVARTQHLGILKERAHPFRSAAAAAAASTPVYSGVFGDQACGSVLDAVDVPGGGSELLAVVQRAAVDADDLRLGSIDGPPLARLPLPYELPLHQPKRPKL